jgi:poly(3-hydroxybutyrate) depolymerase
MKKITTLLTLTLFSALTFAQCNGRYQTEIFSLVTKTTVNYSDVYTDNAHKMDIYTPDGDTETNRPLIIFIHGGTFIAGDKANSDCVDFCEKFAKMGYVTASVNYRIADPVSFFTQESIQYETVLKAVADVKGAIRYFRYDYATINSYNIDTNTIFVGGSSAGAITAIHLAYIDDISDLSSASTIIDLQSLANNNGGIDGDVGYSLYSSQVSGVISFAGGIHNINWIDGDDEPLVSVQGDNDGTVDYNCNQAAGGAIDLILCGSGEMHPQANTINIINEHLLLSGSDHDWFSSGNSDIRFVDALEFTAEFLYPLLPCDNTTPVNEFSTEKKLIELIDVLGRKTKPRNNTPLFYIYDDGSVEQKIIIK